MNIRVDPGKCTGCQACQMACLDQRDILPGAGEKPLCRLEARETETDFGFAFVCCVNCGACVRACPVSAIWISEAGAVLIREEDCVGCRACEAVCPLRVISVSTVTGHARKCDGCRGRVAAGLLPACVHTCPTGALYMDRE